MLQCSSRFVFVDETSEDERGHILTIRFFAKAAVLAVLVMLVPSASAAVSKPKLVRQKCTLVERQAGAAMSRCRLTRPDTMQIRLTYPPLPVFGIIWDTKCGDRKPITKEFALAATSKARLAYKQLTVDARHNRDVYRLTRRASGCVMYFTALAVNGIKPAFAAGIIYTQRPVAR